MTSLSYVHTMAISIFFVSASCGVCTDSEVTSSVYVMLPELSWSRLLKSAGATEPNPISFASSWNSKESSVPVLSLSHFANAFWMALDPYFCALLVNDHWKNSFRAIDPSPFWSAALNHARISAGVWISRIRRGCIA